ncbi:MAG: threonine--tRNA ligase, partial [Chloroflexi bacterium]|nr:threonine--tRNA ligase [Chloroflexota bacterium]
RDGSPRMANEHEIPFDDLPPEERLFRMRHSAAHVLAEAVLEMFPEAKYAIGPPVENGFYYDFELPRTLNPDDLVALQARMRQTVERDLPIVGEQIPKDRAREIFRAQPYKLELIDGIEEETVGYFRHGEFQDLCRGGHTESTGQLGAFKLDRVAGAYWRGDEKNAMLQRVYGLLFQTAEELAAYETMREEAEKRDHRRLGRELDLFHLDAIAPGAPFWHPKGTVLYNGLIDYMRDLYRTYGYQEVVTPQLFSVELWKTSGHYQNFAEDMYMFESDGEEIGVKPMNCPGHCHYFASGLHSYRELPLRLAEFTRLHRNERSGVLHGLTRVRAFSQDDAHIYCTPDQFEGEIFAVFRMIEQVYGDLGLGEPKIRLATRPGKAIGSDEDWEQAIELLGAAVTNAGKVFELAPGEGAFYGPKLEFHFRDAIGRSWQLGTVQVDLGMPESFGLKYIGEDGDEHRPMMIHRAILGSLERFIGVYIEHTGGHFPLWLAPVQAVVIPIADRHLDYAASIRDQLRQRGLRAEVDDGADRMGAKIRKAQLQRIPYMLVVGDREMEQGAAAVRDRTGADLGAIAASEIVDRLAGERDSRVFAGR